MLTPSLLFPIAIRLIRLDRGSIVLKAHRLIHRGRCPTCGVTSARVHDRYQRHPIDLPWRACSVQVALTVRRFRCDNRDCQRRTFAENFGPPLPPELVAPRTLAHSCWIWRRLREERLECVWRAPLVCPSVRVPACG